MMFSAKTYAEKATTAMPKPGKRLANIARLEKTGCLRQASRFAHGSNKDGYFDMGNLKVGDGLLVVGGGGRVRQERELPRGRV
jgi:hypothetical protein